MACKTAVRSVPQEDVSITLIDGMDSLLNSYHT